MLENIQKLLKTEIRQVDELILNLAKSEIEVSQRVISHIINSGGKRLRPLLTLTSAKMFGFEGFEHIRLAVAIEFLHTATLLHDDVVDESSTRRGKKTANSIWGNKVSILVGDFMLSKAFEQMALSNSIPIITELARASVAITEGEVKQLINIENIDLSLEEYLQIIYAKTAPLFSSACVVGGFLTNQSPQTISNLREYGKNLGILFQIIDDNLDYFGKESITGKAVGGDFFEGKITLPLLIGFNTKAKEQFKKLFLAKKTPQNLAKLLALFEQEEIRKKCDDFALTYHNRAKELVQTFKANEYRYILDEILTFSLKRVS
jgi:octaprenyl-diphosphate synthase